MANTTPKTITRPGKSDRRNSRTWKLLDAGVRLLAGHDYDQVTMAQFAKEAGCSVGALYDRFPEKEHYLHHLIASQFRALTHDAELNLDAARWRNASVPELAKHIVSYLVTSMTNKRTAGAIRATIKLASCQPLAIEPFQNYRKAVTERAAVLLERRLSIKGKRAACEVMQVIFATVVDALLLKDGEPLPARSNRMIAALSDMMISYLHLVIEHPRDDDEAAPENDRISEADVGPEPRPTPGDNSIPTYDPDLRVYRGSHRAKSQQGQTHKKNQPATNPGDVIPVPVEYTVVREHLTRKRARFRMI